MLGAMKSLQLLGAPPEVEAPAGPAVAGKGFRPFFLLASAVAALLVPVWLLAYAGRLRVGGVLDGPTWHAHEMLFGVALAVIAGFLLTAVGNWTRRETLVGPPLLALAALWGAGRVVMALSASPLVAALVDLAFLPVLAVVLARPLLAAKDRRNYVLLVVLTALWLANLAVHLDALGVLPGVRRRALLGAVDLVIVVILIIAARVFPMFTRNATGVKTIDSSPRLDTAAVVSMATLAVVDLVWPGSPAAAALAGLTALLVLGRSLAWGARHTAPFALVWVLHVGHAWIPIGLALRALGHSGLLVVGSAPTHALTAGAIGTLTLGMMARVALGHTGRMLEPPRPVVLAFWLVTVGTVVRVLAPMLLPAAYVGALWVAGVAWASAFALYLLAYARVLLGPRVDGKPG
jgi:uncharacterized protein involved in response to NO